LEGYAEELGLDMERFRADMNSEAVEAKIKEDQALARKLGATGTPAFFINGRYLSGAKPYATFQKIVEQEIAWAKNGNRPTFKIGKNVREVQPKRKRRGPDPNKVYTIEIGDSPTVGPDDAKITIVEFFDFQCPYCARVSPTVEKILETYPNDVRFVFKQNPLSFHKKAPLAAEAALAAADQGKYWEMHKKLLENSRHLDRSDLERYAEEIGLDMDAFRKALDTNAHKAMIEADQKQARKLGATGTPAFFINGKFLRGAQPFSVFQKRIEAILEGK
ncbi:MAG: thioredoxin, partial [Deltaproteobacteria bacterium]